MNGVIACAVIPSVTFAHRSPFCFCALEGDACLVIATSECRVINQSNVVGDGYARQARTIIERILTNDSKGVRECYAR